MHLLDKNKGYSKDAYDDLQEKIKVNPELYYHFCYGDCELTVVRDMRYYALDLNGIPLSRRFHGTLMPKYHLRLLNIGSDIVDPFKKRHLELISPSIGKMKYSYVGNWNELDDVIFVFNDIVLRLIKIQKDLF